MEEEMVLLIILPLEKESVVQGGLHPVDRLVYHQVWRLSFIYQPLI